MFPRPYRVVIFDLGDVLFRWFPSTQTSIPAQTLRSIISSDIWHEYERGLLSEAKCYEEVSQQYDLDLSEVNHAFLQARDSLILDHKVSSIIRKLKSHPDYRLSIYAMSNISKPDYAVLRTKFASWDLFDDVFTSGEAGLRKPDPAFYQYVIQAIGTSTGEIVFVDDKLENVFAAQSQGIRAIQFKNAVHLAQTLENLLSESLQRGARFLSANAKKMDSVTNAGVKIQDNFAQLLILEETKDMYEISLSKDVRAVAMYADIFINRELVALEWHEKRWNFFIGIPLLTTKKFPFDLDTTSAALMALDYSMEHIQLMLDDMLQFVNEDGIIMTYFDKARPRIDPVVCVNVLRVFFKYGRGKDLESTLSLVREVLQRRAYLEGTRYYPTAEAFLYFLGRFLETISYSEEGLCRELGSLLAERVRERIGYPGDALCLAMRLLAGSIVGIDNPTDLSALRSMQCKDGGWDASVVYRYGSSPHSIGNRGLATVLAMQAIQKSM